MAKSDATASSAKKSAMLAPEEERGDWFATTLARGISLIQAFGPDDLWLSNAELASRTGLNKPTVSRLSATLIELGYLARDSEGKFRPGVRLPALAYPVFRGFAIRQVARPLMMEVAREIRSAVSLATLDRLSLISYGQKIHPNQFPEKHQVLTAPANDKKPIGKTKT